MRSFATLSQVQFKLFLREPLAFFFTLIFPVLMLILFGLIWGNDPYPGITFGYIDFQVPALAGLVIGTVAFASIPVATATAREQQILRRYKATPMQPITYIASEVLVYLLLSVVSMVVLVAIGKLAFGLRFEGSWIAVIVGFSLSVLSFVATGYVIASLAPTSRVAQVVGNLVYFPMLFLSGATMPLDIMPEGIQNFAQWLPMTHVVALMQDLWLENSWNGTSVIVLLIMLVVGTVVSVRFFRWE